MTDFEREMARQAHKRGCHTVVCGHIHNPELKEVGGIRYINTGDWIENNSYLILNQNYCALYSHGRKINDHHSLQK
jgi:UDP-2,3-diacylglucosamine pyrophosphatase LpxH